MINQQLQDDLGYLMVRSSIRGKFITMQFAEQHGLTLMQAMTLCLLRPGKPVPMNSLSHFFECDPSNITGIVDRLVACGYIDRKEHTFDRRVKNITLTPDGQALRQKIIAVAMEKRLPNLAKLSDDDVRDLLRLLTVASGL